MDDTSPLFSIIVPVYGVEAYIEQCIQSVLDQTYDNFELILVDDGSKDKSGFICDEFAKNDTRIKVIHKKNGGVTTARKEGTKVVSGRYVLCVDGDDFLGNKYLEYFAETIRKTNADIVMDGCVWWTSENKSFSAKVSDGVYGVSIKEGFYNRDNMEKEIFPNLIESKKTKNIQTSVWGKAIKKELFISSQLSVPDNINMGEDICVIKPCIFKAESFAVNGNTEYFYRQVQSSLTRNKNSYKWEVPEKICRYLEDQIPVQEYDFQQQIYRICVHLLFNVCRQHKSFSGIKKEYYKKAIKKAHFSFGTKGWFARLVLSIML